MPDDISDDELAGLALAAGPDPEIEPGTPSWAELMGASSGLLPSWYMPVLDTVPPPISGWRRKAALVLVTGFTAITACGLCVTYGTVGFH